MSLRVRVRGLVCLACVLVAACSSPVKPRPAPLSAALDANRRAEALLRAGDLEGAARGYREALRAAQALEDADAIAANAVNLSIVYQRLGKLEDARASLAPVLEQPNLSFPHDRLAQASLRRAIVDLDQHRLASAAEWAGRAESHCDGSCGVSAAIHNVRGQISLEGGDAGAASASARRALEASRASGDRAEAANALRLLGVSTLRAGDPAAALAHVDQALAIDRELAAPRKIWLDLVWLGRISALRGERESALAYYERALTVSEAENDARGAAEVHGLMRGLAASATSR